MMMKKVRAMNRMRLKKNKNIEHKQLNKNQQSNGEIICGSVIIDDSNNRSNNNNTSMKQYI